MHCKPDLLDNEIERLRKCRESERRLRDILNNRSASKSEITRCLQEVKVSPQSVLFRHRLEIELNSLNRDSLTKALNQTPLKKRRKERRRVDKIRALLLNYYCSGKGRIPDNFKTKEIPIESVSSTTIQQAKKWLKDWEPWQRMIDMRKNDSVGLEFDWLHQAHQADTRHVHAITYNGQQSLSGRGSATFSGIRNRLLEALQALAGGWNQLGKPLPYL